MKKNKKCEVAGKGTPIFDMPKWRKELSTIPRTDKLAAAQTEATILKYSQKLLYYCTLQYTSRMTAK